MCAASDWGDKDGCKVQIVKNATSSTSSFKYHLASSKYEHESDNPELLFDMYAFWKHIYKKSMEYDEKHNCKVKVKQESVTKIKYMIIHIRRNQRTSLRARTHRIYIDMLYLFNKKLN